MTPLRYLLKLGCQKQFCMYTYIYIYIYYIYINYASICSSSMSKLSKYQPGFAQMHEAWRLACLVQVQHDTLAASRLHETISILKTTNPLHVLYWFNWFSYVQLYLHFSGASLMVYPPNTLCLNTKVTTPSAVPWL